MYVYILRCITLTPTARFLLPYSQLQKSRAWTSRGQALFCLPYQPNGVVDLNAADSALENTGT